jgi:hypothetical protein
MTSSGLSAYAQIWERGRNVIRPSKVLAPATGYPDRPEPGEFESRLNLDVVFTSVEPTLAALKKLELLQAG